MRILLIRHGEPDYTTDTLTPTGRREAELLSRRMAAYHIRDYYVSPLGRARETAEYTLRAAGREAEILPWLAEFRARYYDAEAGHERICWDLKPRVWTAHPELADPENWADSPVYAGGNAREVWEETRSGVDALMSRYGFRRDGAVWLSEHNCRDTIALFCHFGVSCVLLSHLMNVSPFVLWHMLCLQPSSVTELVTEERQQGTAAFRALQIGGITEDDMKQVLPYIGVLLKKTEDLQLAAKEHLY